MKYGEGKLDEQYVHYLEEQWAKQPDPLPEDFGLCNICEEEINEDESICDICHSPVSFGG